MPQVEARHFVENPYNVPTISKIGRKLDLTFPIVDFQSPKAVILTYAFRCWPNLQARYLAATSASLRSRH